MLRPPSKIKPPAGPEIYDFPRDIQPILDKRCLACHGPTKTAEGGPYAGKVLLDGGRGPMYSHSYWTIFSRRLISHGRDANGNRAPRTIGSSASRLMKLIDGSHYKVKLSARERMMIRLWIETAAAYPGTYAALGCGSIGGVGGDRGMRKVFAARCGKCHRGGRFNSNYAFNLSDPEKSLVLTMPLNGMVRKVKKDGKMVAERVVIFKDTKDPGYQAILAGVSRDKARLDRIKRFDMPGFRPNVHYLREMKVYGILPKDFDLAKDPADPYELDRKYWESHWHKPRKSDSITE